MTPWDLLKNLLTNRKNMSIIKLYFGFDRMEVVYVFHQTARGARFGTACKERKSDLVNGTASSRQIDPVQVFIQRCQSSYI